MCYYQGSIATQRTQSAARFPGDQPTSEVRTGRDKFPTILYTATNSKAAAHAPWDKAAYLVCDDHSHAELVSDALQASQKPPELYLPGR